MAGRYYILNDQHELVPTDAATWSQWFETIETRRVAEDMVGRVRVSSVCLGLDHRFYGEGPPIVFETMVFGGPLNEEMERSCTWDEALGAHARLLAKVIAARRRRPRS